MLSLPAKVAIGASTLAGLLTLALGGIAFDLSRSRLMSAYDQQLATQSEGLARHVGQMLRTIDRNLQANARNTMFANALGDTGGRDYYLAPFLKDFVEVADVPVFVELRDYRGRPLASNPLAAPRPVPEARVQAVIDGGQARAWIDLDGGEANVAMVAPVIYANTGLPEGALVYQFALRSASHQGWMDDAGDTAVEVRLADRRVLAMGATAILAGDGLEATRPVALPALFGDAGMAVRAVMPRAALDHALSRLVTMHLLAAAGVLGVIVPLSVLMARRMLRRLMALEEVANSVIATGRMDARVEAQGDDEIARLSSAFNHMLDRLHEAQRELQRERAREVARYAERTRRILATTQEGYLLVAADSAMVLETNQAFCDLLGMALDTVIGRPLPPFLAPVVTEVGEPGSPASLLREVEAEGAGGRRVVLLANASIDVDEHGKRSVFLFLTDISDRRAAEDALQEKSADLERSNAELQQFAYAASHDLQEPLRMVTAYLKLLREKMGDDLDDDTREFIGFASDGTKRMSQLIRDLLDYSRVDSRGGEFDPVDCAEVLDEALLNLKVRIQEEQAVVVVPPNLPVILADRAQIVRLFQNIVGNAVKFHAPDRPCRIEIGVAAPHGGLCHITVSDNGIGIDPAFHARIFDAFQRLHSRAEYEGTGLGLALVKRIVDRHHGRVWVDSTPGAGATFHLALPMAEARPELRRVS